MIIEQTYQGAWQISEIINDQLRTETYFYYSKRESIELFKQFKKTIEGGTHD